jgi:hypothetical protein
MLLPIRKYRPEDSEYLCPRAIEMLLHNTDSWREWAKLNAVTGPAYTCEIDGKPVVSAGVRILKADNGEMVGWPWFVMNEDARKYRFSLFRMTKHILLMLAREFNLSRLVTDSQKGFDASQRLLEHLGFRRLPNETKIQYFYEMRL